jgi:hypothetical protein
MSCACVATYPAHPVSGDITKYDGISALFAIIDSNSFKPLHDGNLARATCVSRISASLPKGMLRQTRETGDTVLHAAVNKGSVLIVKALLSAGMAGFPDDNSSRTYGYCSSRNRRRC